MIVNKQLNVTECPVCCKRLDGFTNSFIDFHVNMCLDFSIHNNNNNNNNQPKSSFSSTSSLLPSFTGYNYYNNKFKRKKKLKKCSISSLSKLEYYYKYKVLNGNSNVVIDGFSGSSKYAPTKSIFFLTHYHTDHYAGLNSTFKNGKIYCSEITSRLLIKNMHIDQQYVVALPMFTKCLIHNTNPLTYVTLLEANHCPGAVMFLFEMDKYTNNSNNIDVDQKQMDTTVKYHLHVGDARLEFEQDSFFYKKNNNILSKYHSKIDKLYLDTTYCDTHKCLPRQSDAIDFIVNKIKSYLNGYNNDVVILIGTYSIGKERILHKINSECNKKIFITQNKQSIFSCVYADNKLNSIYTNNKNETNIYVVGMADINFSSMWKYKKTNNTTVIGFKPTGWTNKSSKHKKHCIYPQYSNNNVRSLIIYKVPYSEHSSFAELCKFVKDMDPKEIIPTVNNKTNIAVQKQIEYLNGHKDKIEYSYQPLFERNNCF